ncbi:MAG: PD-(D/E)XK nuclease family protein, partial [Tumebacillaceae bacterium]
LFGMSDEALYWLGTTGLMASDWRETANWQKIAVDDREKLLRAARFLRRWREEKAFKSAGDLLSGILEMTGYEQALLLTFGGSQKVGNVRKLLDLAYDQPADRAGVVPFLQYLHLMIEEGVDEEDAQVESDTSNVVKVMTVHKSKGLEFPVVILPDMAREFNTRTDGKFQYDAEFGLAVSFAENEEWNEFGFAPQMRDLDKQKAKEEERRKLYVAVTRARDYLILVGTREEPSKPMNLDAGRWFDWLVAAIADGQLSQMEGTLQAEWPEVKWVVESDLEAGVVEEVGSRQDGRGELSVWDEIAAGVEAAAVGADMTEERRGAFPLLGAIVPQADQVPGILLSVSALMTYLTCPRQYFYKYEWKLPERKPVKEVPEEEIVEWEPSAREVELEQSGEMTGGLSPNRQSAVQANAQHEATERGTLVHRVLEWIERPEEADELIRRALAERSIVGEAYEQLFDELKRNVETYLQSDLFREVQTAEEQQSEMKFRLVLGKHEITGIVDKIIRKQGDSAVVIDYKTNRDASAKTVHHYEPQLQLYTLVAQRLLGWSVERAVLYFTALGREVQVPTTEADLHAMEQGIQSACDHIALHDQVEDFEQVADESPCKYCGYFTLCKGGTIAS